MAEDKNIKKSDTKITDKTFDPKKYIEIEPTLDEMIQKLVENFLTERKPLTVQQRRKRGMTMRRYKNKIAMARKRASKRRASGEVLTRRSRKKARDIIRKKLMKSKNYAEMTPSEKMALDKRVARVSPATIDRLAKRQLPQVRKAEIQRLASLNKKDENFDINSKFDLFLEEMSCGDNGNKSPKRYHNLLTKENSVKIDKRFKIFKPKTNNYFESVDSFSELNDLIEAVENLNFNEDAGSVKHHLGIGSNFKHMQKHALSHIDYDNDGDVDADDFNKLVPDEITGAEKKDYTKIAAKKNKDELKHTKKGVAFEGLEEKSGLWANIRKRREKGLPRLKPGQEGYPKTLDIEEWMEGLDLLDEEGILDKALNAIHKHILKGENLGDIAWDISRAAGVNMSSRALEKAYVSKYGSPDAKKTGPTPLQKALIKKYGFKSEELDRILDEIDASKATNREQGTDSLVKIYKKDTPGQQSLQEVALNANVKRGDIVRFNHDTLVTDEETLEETLEGTLEGTFVGTDKKTGGMRIRDESGKLYIVKHSNVFSE
jgi:hypothetical protein